MSIPKTHQFHFQVGAAHIALDRAERDKPENVEGWLREAIHAIRTAGGFPVEPAAKPEAPNRYRAGRITTGGSVWFKACWEAKAWAVAHSETNPGEIWGVWAEAELIELCYQGVQFSLKSTGLEFAARTVPVS